MAILSLSLEARVQSDDNLVSVPVGHLEMFGWSFENPHELADWLESALGERGFGEDIRARFVGEACPVIEVMEGLERQISSLKRERNDALQRLSTAAK